jgi:hypothetical protein
VKINKSVEEIQSVRNWDMMVPDGPHNHLSSSKGTCPTSPELVTQTTSPFPRTHCCIAAEAPGQHYSERSLWRHVEQGVIQLS